MENVNVNGSEVYLAEHYRDEIFDELFKNRDEAKGFIRFVVSFMGWDRETCDKNYGLLKLVLKHHIYYKYSKEEVLEMAFEEDVNENR